MSKREAPAMKLTIENGRLVPASAWDQERLLTYRNHSTINAYITQDKMRKRERQYWAILDLVIKTCGVAQRTSEDLHDHIKLKLGFVNAKFDDNGKLKVTLKSTKLMEDQEYEGFFKEAMGFLFDMTGVDPMTLKKESADVGEDESEPSDAAPPSSDVGRDAANPSAAVAATNLPETANENGPETGAATSIVSEAIVQGGIPVGANASHSGVTSPGGENPAPYPTLPLVDRQAEHECIAKMMATALDKTITPKEAAEILADGADMWLGLFTDDRKPFVTAVFQTCKKVLRNELPADKAKEYLKGLAA